MPSYKEYKSKRVTTIRFDKELLKEYSGYDVENPETYFKEHPRAKKPPYNNLWKKSRTGMIPSVNTFLNVNDRNIQNVWEQHLKDYCEFCMKKQGLKHDYIGQCIIIAIQFKPTRTKSDPHNCYDKPFIDAMVERELLQEDNYTVVKLHMEHALYYKQDPHSEIRIYEITDEYPFEFVANCVIKDIAELQGDD